MLAACVDPGTGSAPTSKYTVSFETDGGSAVSSVVVTGGTTLDTTLSKTIAAPTKAASGSTIYYFGDWYTVDKAKGHTGKTKYDSTKPVTGNITLYARWYTKQPADKTALETLIADLGNTADFNHIDVRKVTDMSSLFASKTTFNGDITGWDVSGVTHMHQMFGSAFAFNQPIGDWDVSDVTDMHEMFYSADAFNQPIGDWDVSGVTDMHQMFSTVVAFDQDISGWTVSQVTDYKRIFESCPIIPAHKPPKFR
ncbi:BspA family leucine-rich repeat surface protein [Candidatus Haliotispira prima]|uniref:BspA family leucine-rich repeat surface protein n=1 Tax=Candidatus Haliotispira prima TaxID=3034016 RepID=A0ABY8MMF5_9SPIO|nr:BspA family leucine-rich repeat surface protein [Candidatus Haliotispira prima]